MKLSGIVFSMRLLFTLYYHICMTVPLKISQNSQENISFFKRDPNTGISHLKETHNSCKN